MDSWVSRKHNVTQDGLKVQNERISTNGKYNTVHRYEGIKQPNGTAISEVEHLL